MTPLFQRWMTQFIILKIVKDSWTNHLWNMFVYIPWNSVIIYMGGNLGLDQPFTICRGLLDELKSWVPARRSGKGSACERVSWVIGVWLQGGATLGRSQGGEAIFPGVRFWDGSYGWAVNIKKCGGGVEGSRHLLLKHGGVTNIYPWKPP